MEALGERGKRFARNLTHAQLSRGVALPVTVAGMCTVASSRLGVTVRSSRCADDDARRLRCDADRRPLGHGRSLSMTVYGVVRRRA